MRFREFLLPLVTGLAIFSMSVFISCASKSRIDEDGNEIEETSVSESGEDSGSTAPPTKGEDNLGELPPSNEKIAAITPPPPAAEPTLSADALPPADQVPPPGGDLANLPPETAPPPADSLPADSLPADGLPTDSLPPDSAPTGKIAAAAPPTEAGLPPASDLPPAGDLPPVTDLPAVAATDIPPVIGEAPIDGEPKPRAAVGGGSSVPKIPANAVTRAGTPLNRFYFLRKGDTKSSVAEMIYGDSSKAKELSKWNKGGFNTGRLVFYQSPVQPDDKEMKPFYQEKSIAPVDYTVQKGDWLSNIAAKKLGSGASWKEIAVLNGIESPSALEVGQKYSIYPLQGNSQSMAANEAPPAPAPDAEPIKKSGKKKRGKKTAVAENEPSNPNFKSADAPIPTPGASDAPLIQAEGTPQAAAPVPLPTESVPAVETFKKKKKAGGFDLLRLIEQNLFFLILGLGVVVLVTALFFVNKRRKAKAAEAEFGDDAFASPKAKRR